MQTLGSHGKMCLKYVIKTITFVTAPNVSVFYNCVTFHGIH